MRLVPGKLRQLRWPRHEPHPDGVSQTVAGRPVGVSDDHLRIGMELVPIPLARMSVQRRFPAQWKGMRGRCLGQAGSDCEACGAPNESGTHQVHEVWAYDDEHRTQTLTGVVLLCTMCHAVKHWCPDFFEYMRKYRYEPQRRERGWDDEQIREWVHATRTTAIGRIPRMCANGGGVTRRLSELNGWDTEQLTRYVIDKTWEWYRRNDYDEWTQVLGDDWTEQGTPVQDC